MSVMPGAPLIDDLETGGWRMIGTEFLFSAAAAGFCRREGGSTGFQALNMTLRWASRSSYCASTEWIWILNTQTTA